MVFVNHIITTTTAGYILNLKEPYQLGIIAIASILPDRLEYLGFVRILSHRTITHSLLFWFLFFAFSYFFVINKPEYYFIIWKCLLIGIAGHLSGDMLTRTGIPVFVNKPRIAFKLFKTGSIIEYFISILMLIIIFLLIKKNA